MSVAHAVVHVAVHISHNVCQCDRLYKRIREMGDKEHVGAYLCVFCPFPESTPYFITQECRTKVVEDLLAQNVYVLRSL